MKAVKAHDGIELQKRMEKYEKIDKIKEDNPTVAKQYLETRIIYDCRMIFRIRTEMLDLKDNMGRRYKGSNTYCEACDHEVPESQAHVMVWPAYQEFRAGWNLSENKDLVLFYRDVLNGRQKRTSMTRS